MHITMKKKLNITNNLTGSSAFGIDNTSRVRVDLPSLLPKIRADTKSSVVQSAGDVGTEVRFEGVTHRSLNKRCHFFSHTP